jgi:hypothetical protein
VCEILSCFTSVQVLLCHTLVSCCQFNIILVSP